MTLDTILRLGRVSNLPTVWTNALAGAVLAGGAPAPVVVLAALALSLFYVGGMWLNDAFDAEIDAIERPSRPIPSGKAARATVFRIGYLLLLLGLILCAALGLAAALVGLALAATVVLYDATHKRTALAPVIMGATRLLAYLLGAMAAGGLTAAALVGALGLFAYVVGLTYAAKQEAYDRIDHAWPLAVLAVPALLVLRMAPASLLTMAIAAGLLAVLAFALHRLFRRARGDVPRAVVTMIAGIALYDAALIAATGASGLALLAVAAFALTLLLQRVAPGT
jgi:4-hydroxybenzoate polyprenyltransferase